MTHQPSIAILRFAAPKVIVALMVVVTSLIAQPMRAEKSAAAPRVNSSMEQLVIWTDSRAETSVARRFSSEHLPAIQAAALELGLDVEVIDVAVSGAPPEIHVTPLVTYQSPRGRAYFQGRYVDTGKVTHFVRTQRAVPPLAGEETRNDVAVLADGRARVVSPIKVTALAGDVPPTSAGSAAVLLAESRRSIVSGFERYSLRDEIQLGPSDRAFYMDFHPYFDDGTLYVSTALFSQWNCIEPVFTRFDDPISGPWEERQLVFARAARQLEDEVLRQMRESKIGDGFSPVSSTVAQISWQDLGLPLPVASAADQQALATGIEMPTRWRAEAADAAGPRLIFRFPSPLERYSGEVPQLDAALDVSGGWDKASGWIEAETASVTMGETSLDQAIRSKMIKADTFPQARFELGAFQGAEEPLAFGRVTQLVAEGTFKMMGKAVPLQVKAQLEPIVGADGQPRLQVRAGFNLRLSDPFGVQGPDGPAPANDTLVFHLNLSMVGDGPARQ